MRRIDVLSVSPDPADHRALQRIFNGPPSNAADLCEWRLFTTDCLSGALGFLRRAPCAVVLCERYLPLGDWRDLLEHARQLPKPPMLIVTSRHADDYLWAEALNLGAYDVLAKPFERNEITRAVRLAGLRWSRETGNEATAPTEARAPCSETAASTAKRQSSR